MAESDNILTKRQDLLVNWVSQLSKSPSDQKFVLGDRIETQLPGPGGGFPTRKEHNENSRMEV